MDYIDFPFAFINNFELNFLLKDDTFDYDLPRLDISNLITSTCFPSSDLPASSLFTDSILPCSYSSTADIHSWPSLRNQFTILSLNIRSLSTNLIKLKLLLLNFTTKPDIIAITETWLLPNNSLKLLHLESYTLISIPRNNRKKRGGGLAFYVNSALDFSVKPSSNLNLANSCEYSTIEIIINSSFSLTILNIYRPPDLDNQVFIDSLTDFIECFKSNKKNVFITGDFNINLLEYNSSTTSSRFLDLMISSGFLPSITIPTRITQNSASLIDNIFIKLSRCEHYSKVILDDISDHFPTLFSCSLLTTTRKNLSYSTSYKRIFSNQNFAICQSIASSINWEPVTQNHPDLLHLTPSQSYKLFHDKILFLYNAAFPLLKSKPTTTKRSKSLPWITPEIKSECHKKSPLKKIY